MSKVPSLLIDFKPTTQFDPVKVWLKLKREEQTDGAEAARQVSRRVQEIRERNDEAREKVCGISPGLSHIKPSFVYLQRDYQRDHERILNITRGGM